MSEEHDLSKVAIILHSVLFSLEKTLTKKGEMPERYSEMYSYVQHFGEAHRQSGF